MYEFDKLFAVSDLHIGGPKGRQAFRETEALAWLIQRATDDPASRVALVLNGDVVDFLADEPAEEFTTAPDWFLRRLPGLGFAPIFRALATFVAKPNRHLVVVLGNHDIEMALAPAQSAFLELIDARAEGRRARVIFETSGSGFLCTVSGRLTLLVHGNAADPWNEVDHAGLERAALASAAGQAVVPRPVTNAGTALVVHVMNGIKDRYPFVDLLKPEGLPLMAILDAVDAKQSVAGFIRAFGKRIKKGSLAELLGEGVAPREESVPAQGPDREVLAFLERVEAEMPAARSIDALRRAEEHLTNRRDPRSLVENGDEKLGRALDFGRLQLHRLERGIRRLRGEPAIGPLRRALVDWLKDDQTFSFENMADIDVQICDGAIANRKIMAHGAPAAVLIAGHTHLPKQLARPEGVYLNTGTWMRLLRLTEGNALTDDAAFASVFEALKSPRLEDIDALKIDPRWRPVAIVDRDRANLFSVQGGGLSGYSLRGLVSGGDA